MWQRLTSKVFKIGLVVLLMVVAVSCEEASPVANQAPPPFERVWRACGGRKGAGGWLRGTAWYQGHLWGVTTRMVFVKPSYAPAEAVPFAVYSEEAPAPPREGFVYQNGHNTLQDFLDWISNHGGQMCYGEPISEPYKEGMLTCQHFEYITLCHDPDQLKVIPQDMGREFLAAKGNNLRDDLPVSAPPAEGWLTQVNMSLDDTQRGVDVAVRVQAPPGQHADALAVELGESRQREKFYIDLLPASVLTNGVWETHFALPPLPPGTHVLVIRVCSVTTADAWRACDEDSATLKVSAPQSTP